MDSARVREALLAKIEEERGRREEALVGARIHPTAVAWEDGAIWGLRFGLAVVDAEEARLRAEVVDLRDHGGEPREVDVSAVRPPPGAR